MSLFAHEKREKRHPKLVVNANEQHAVEINSSSFNQQLAVLLTAKVGSMWTAYLFAGIALVGLLGILNVLPPVIALLVAWASQTLIQLVLLPVIMVGQNVLSRKQELQTEQQFATTINTFHDIEEIMAHLDAQDAHLLNLEQQVLALVQRFSDEHSPTES